MRNQEEPGGTRKSQKEQGEARRSPGGPRTTQYYGTLAPYDRGPWISRFPLKGPRGNLGGARRTQEGLLKTLDIKVPFKGILGDLSGSQEDPGLALGSAGEPKEAHHTGLPGAPEVREESGGARRSQGEAMRSQGGARRSQEVLGAPGSLWKPRGTSSFSPGRSRMRTAVSESRV